LEGSLVTALSDQKPVRKWLGWEDIIRRNLYQAFHDRQLWQETTAAAQQVSPEAPGAWLMHYARLYSDGQAMAIRRIVRGQDHRSASLERLLGDICNNPGVLSAPRYVSHFPAGSAGSALEEYERLWGDGTGRVMSVGPSRVSRS
jgi:hypothetical protein